MGFFGLKILSVSFGIRAKQTRVFQPVKLYTNGIGRFTDLGFELAEVGTGVVVEEKFQQQLYPGFGCYQRL